MQNAETCVYENEYLIRILSDNALSVKVVFILAWWLSRPLQTPAEQTPGSHQEHVLG